jgi:hypothetical protein
MTFDKDIANAIMALEHYIITEERDLISNNSGDPEWQRLNSFETSLKNLKYLRSIYT